MATPGSQRNSEFMLYTCERGDARRRIVQKKCNLVLPKVIATRRGNKILFKHRHFVSEIPQLKELRVKKEKAAEKKLFGHALKRPLKAATQLVTKETSIFQKMKRRVL